jgi:hypothetical protein
LTAADFNGDGKLDLAISDENAQTVSILLGNGDGTFQTHVDYAVGNDPTGIVAADFNGDGKIDLAVSNFNDSTVSILLGNGDGSFKVQALASVGTGPNSLASGDFNGDGKVDLITSNGGGTATVLLSRGDGTFNRVDSQSGADSPALAVGDFDRDGKLDTVVASQRTQQVILLKGNGDGSFQTPVIILSGSLSPIAYTFALAADFNHDSKLDLALGGAWILLGRGDGTFQSPVLSPPGADTASLAAADFNGDGEIDLVATDSNLGSVDALLGTGNGTFGGIGTVTLAQTVYGPDAAVAADFNGDGKLDLAVAETNFPNGQVSVELGRGNGTFAKPITSPLIAQGTNNQDLMLTGDFNGDGKPDLVLLDDYGNGFEVLLGNGDGTFQSPVDTVINTVTFAVGDFNGDGKTDLVVTTNSGFQAILNIYLSNGNGTFRLIAQYTENNGSPTVADVNQDGKLDLVIAGFSSPLQVLLGNGDGTFQSPISGPSALYSGGLVIGDFNGDGKPDVAVGTYDGIAFLAGNGDGTFQNPLYSNSTLEFSGRMHAGDFSGDGRLDLVTYPPGNSTLSGAVVMAGNGNGTFQLPVAYGQTGPWPVDLVTGDFNSDHVDDVGMPNQSLSSGRSVVSLYLSVPEPNLFPNALNFGAEAVGKTSRPKKVKLTNWRNAPLEISGITVSGDFLAGCGKIPSSATESRWTTVGKPASSAESENATIAKKIREMHFSAAC